MSRTRVTRAYQHRFYPAAAEAGAAAHVRVCPVVSNKALQARTEAWDQQQRQVNYAETSALLSAWKKIDELVFLNEASSVPLPQALRHLQGAFANSFVRHAQYPRFKSRKKSRASAEYTALHSHGVRAN